MVTLKSNTIYDQRMETKEDMADHSNSCTQNYSLSSVSAINSIITKYVTRVGKYCLSCFTEF